MRVISTTVDYTWLGKLENELRSSIYQIKEIQYLDQVNILVYVEETQKEAYTAWITELTNGQGHITEEEKLYLEEEFS
jgi:putative IMPACT (imprinted ancient) family translation regulator